MPILELMIDWHQVAIDMRRISSMILPSTIFLNRNDFASRQNPSFRGKNLNRPLALEAFHSNALSLLVISKFCPHFLVIPGNTVILP